MTRAKLGKQAKKEVGRESKQGKRKKNPQRHEWLEAWRSLQELRTDRAA